jgi:hypothetical protein
MVNAQVFAGRFDSYGSGRRSLLPPPRGRWADRSRATRLTVCPLEKVLHVCAQAPLDCFVASDLRQRARLGAQRAAQPSRYRRARKHHVSKPRWIELNLDLFETRGGDRVLMGGAGPV